MATQFYPLTITDIRKETGSCISIAFEIPAHLSNTFLYQAGQYLTLNTLINGEEFRRSYSICAAPYENELRIAVKKVPDGKYSTYLHSNVKIGDAISVMPPMGKFTLTNINANKHYMAFAAGSGITPIISIIKTVLAANEKASFTLVYGNKNRHEIIFKEALEALKNTYMHRFRIVYVLSQEVTEAALNHGRIDVDKCAFIFNKLITQKIDEYFICGPSEMLFAVNNYLLSKGVEQSSIHFELFTTANSKKDVSTQQAQVTTEKSNAKVTIIQDGRSLIFDTVLGVSNILDTALGNGADLPYACKGGVCCTCKAKLIEGTVDMEVNYGLEKDELENGYILTCQSVPTSPSVVISYDV